MSASTVKAEAVPPWRTITAIAVLVAGCLAFLMFWPSLLDVWWTGSFRDSDDAMRVVQVRSWLAGQPWFDLTAYRLDPPDGSSMHWSRVVDVPLGFLIEAFARFTDRATAETLTRLVFPFALILGLFAGIARLADTLLGPVARLPAIAATLLCGGAIVSFQPGRIGHHAPQVVILVFMVEAAVAALDPAKARRAAAAGSLAGLSLAISLENLPFIAALTAILVAMWVWHGAAMARLIGAFGAGLALGLGPSYAATVAPDHWFAPVCDALGIAHLGAGLIGAAGCLAFARLPGHRARGALRLAAAAALAMLVLAFIALATPACLRDPFAAVDPLVREIWISNVTESRPFMRFLREDPTVAALLALPVGLGLCGCLVAALATGGLAARRMLILAGLTAMGLAMTFWQIRVFTFVTPLAVMGALPLAVALHGRLVRRGHDLMGVLALCLVFPFTSLAWALVLPDGPAGATKPPNTCLAAASFVPLAALPPGRVLAPIDAGSFFLAHTGLSVFSAPYHRNNDGNRFALDAFMALPDTAVAMLAARGATYVAICAGLHETETLADRAPQGLAAALLSGRSPPGLTLSSPPNTPYRVFRLVPAGK